MQMLTLLLHLISAPAQNDNAGDPRTARVHVRPSTGDGSLLKQRNICIVFQPDGYDEITVLANGGLPGSSSPGEGAVYGRPDQKLHVQSAYQRKLIGSSFRNTSRQMGYTPNQNVFHAFVGDDESSCDIGMITMEPGHSTALGEMGGG
jgi:hypothetical protein